MSLPPTFSPVAHVAASQEDASESSAILTASPRGLTQAVAGLLNGYQIVVDLFFGRGTHGAQRHGR